MYWPWLTWPLVASPFPSFTCCGLVFEHLKHFSAPKPLSSLVSPDNPAVTTSFHSPSRCQLRRDDAGPFSENYRPSPATDPLPVTPCFLLLHSALDHRGTHVSPFCLSPLQREPRESWNFVTLHRMPSTKGSGRCVASAQSVFAERMNDTRALFKTLTSQRKVIDLIEGGPLDLGRRQRWAAGPGSAIQEGTQLVCSLFLKSFKFIW